MTRVVGTILDPNGADPGYTPPRRVRALLAVTLLLAIGLTGCVRIKAAITISPDDRVSGRILVVAKDRGDDDPGPQLDANQPLGQKVAVSRYKHEGFVGSQAVFSDLTFAELPRLATMHPDAAGVNLSLRRSGNTVILEGRADLSALTDQDAEIDLTVAFPGTVVTTDGARVGSDSVRWKLSPGAVNTMNASVLYSDPSVRAFVGGAVLLGLAALAVAGIVGGMAWRGRDRTPTLPRHGASDSSAPSGARGRDQDPDGAQ